MFTGIIEETGVVKKITKDGHSLKLTIQANRIMEDMKLGDSIAVNGVCLTVTVFDRHFFAVDVMPETFQDTSLALLKMGAEVNLERAIIANGRFGGHFVTGHVDCVGSILHKKRQENSLVMEVEVPEEYTHLLLEKGSVSIDGTSLTIFQASDHSLTVSIIPHTADVSIVGKKLPGDIVNLEFDMMAKYFYQFMQRGMKSSPKTNAITSSFLKENGFY
ncbi:riboflavin synthase [Niallia sp. NCCP-28]|uniref:riboflavin synthase n=1 Tax=Niallia sp. NCCP-28 TaxID=2934712 RepID=UPI00207E314E|nr:riboflavin synthase [Niallia sp. NCCP-28]GKU80850.1 riboflavin synthase subunit alpha [Niallia sp. NCCP-28]